MVKTIILPIFCISVKHVSHTKGWT